jgi:hypothetical protein
MTPTRSACFEAAHHRHDYYPQHGWVNDTHGDADVIGRTGMCCGDAETGGYLTTVAYQTNRAFDVERFIRTARLRSRLTRARQSSAIRARR